MSFFQVLKAIGLQRTGKQDEAFTLAQEVATLEPTDDNSLQALTILYREMHRRKYNIMTQIEFLVILVFRFYVCLFTAELVTKLYEAAVKKVPLSEEYHSHLFMAYARVGEYKKMQQVRQLTSTFDHEYENTQWLLICSCKFGPLQAGMALYKIVPKNPYYFWSVMSLVMQVRSMV